MNRFNIRRAKDVSGMGGGGGWVGRGGMKIYKGYQLSTTRQTSQDDSQTMPSTPSIHNKIRYQVYSVIFFLLGSSN